MTRCIRDKTNILCLKTVMRIVGCPGTQSFQLYAKVSFSVPIGG